MVIKRNGYAVAMFKGVRPKVAEPANLFGPVIDKTCTFLSENLNSNGLRIFTQREEAFRATRERRQAFRSEGLGARVVGVEIRIAESNADWEELRKFGSYIAVVGKDLNDCLMFGTATVDGVRAPSAHDYWAPLHLNGLTTFSSFGDMVGETGLGVVSELSRQCQEFTRLVGFKIHLP